MIAVWYDDVSDQVWITGLNQSFAPRTLTCEAIGDFIRIRQKFTALSLVHAHYADLTGRDLIPFGSVTETCAYLASIFERRTVPQIDPMLEMGALHDLGGHRVICAVPDGIVYASCDVAESCASVIGITSAAISAGSYAQLVACGLMQEPSWSFAPGPVFLGREGLLTQAAPTSGVVLQVAVALGANRILVGLHEPYHLAS